MTPDQENYGYTQQPYPPGGYPPPRSGVTWRSVAVLFFGSVVFGIVCIAVGVVVTRHLNRIETLENSLNRQEPRYAAPVQQQIQQPVQPVIAPQQPNIYFMVGGQGGGYPQYGAPAPGYYPPAPLYPTQVNIDPYLAQRQGNAAGEYLMQRGPGQPYRDTYAAPQNMGYNTLPYYRDGLVVPASLVRELREKIVGNPYVEEWFQEEIRQNVGATGGGDQRQGGEPGLDEILKTLAETNFADKNYERASRIYTELASRQVHLTKAELLQWAKAAELSGDIESALKIMELIYQNYPEDHQVLTEMATLLVGNQRFTEAAEVYGRLMAVEPNNREWRVMRGKTLTWSGQGAKAVELLRQLHEETPDDWELSVMLVELLLSEHQFEDALPLLDRMITYRPDDDSLRRNKIDTLEALQRFSEAANLIEEILPRFEDDESLWLKLAKDRMAAGEYLAAVPAFERYLEARPDDMVIREELGDALMAGNSFTAASVQFGLISDSKPEDSEIRAKYANALMAGRDFDRAAYVYSFLFEEKPGDREIAMGYVVSLRMSGALDGAFDAAIMHLTRSPGDAKMMIQAAEIAFDLEQYEVAVKWFQDAIRVNPENSEWRVSLGKIMLWGRDYEMAETEFRTALIYEPASLEARRGLARALFLQRKYDDAWSTYEDLIRHDPLNTAYTAEYRYYQAIAVGMEDEAQKQLQILTNAEPEEITWKGDRVQSLLRQNRFGEAISAADVVYRQDPEHRATRVGMMNMNQYLTSYPVMLRGGILRKKSEVSDRPEQDRQANIAYRYFGLHGEGSYDYNWRIHADLDKEYWDVKTAGIDDVSATKLRLGAKYEGNPDLWAWGELGYRWFKKGSVDDQIVYDLRGEMRELGNMPLTVGVFSRRREQYDNWMNVYDGLYAVDFGVDATYRWKKWDFFGKLQGTVMNDNNSMFNLVTMARYRLMETPCFVLEVGPDFEIEDWKYNRPEYYSPQNMWKAGVAIDGRYYVCRDPEVWGSPSSYVDFGLMMYRDRFSSFGQKMFLGFNHDYSTRLSLFARLDYTHESYYDEFKLFGGLQYKFGGCDE